MTTSRIVEYAESRAVELVVMPTHGRTGIAHLLFGSVAEKVVRLVRCREVTIPHSGAGR